MHQMNHYKHFKIDVFQNLINYQVNFIREIKTTELCLKNVCIFI